MNLVEILRHKVAYMNHVRLNSISFFLASYLSVFVFMLTKNNLLLTVMVAILFASHKASLAHLKNKTTKHLNWQGKIKWIYCSIGKCCKIMLSFACLFPLTV